MEYPLFSFILLSATLLCSLVAGFLFAFAVVAMPGFKRLNDREFIRAFQVIDGVIQNRQPLFMLVWIGSVVALLAAAAIGIGQLHGYDRIFITSAVILYLFGVQLPTLMVNVPLNDRLQTLQIDVEDDIVVKTARLAFEPRWNRSNTLRTTLACLTSAQLLVILFRL